MWDDGTRTLPIISGERGPISYAYFEHISGEISNMAM